MATVVKSMARRIIVFCIASSILLSLIHVQEVKSATVVHPYDWVKLGAYARYYTREGIELVYPNGTQEPVHLGASIALQWTIVNRTGNGILLNVTFSVQGENYLGAQVNYSKTLFVNADLYTRESTVDGESIGKTFFWAEPYLEVGDNVTLITNPDLWVGKVARVLTGDFWGMNQTLKSSNVEFRQNDPNAQAFGYFAFSYWTGVCLHVTLIGAPWIVPPELYGNFKYRYDNGTEYNITRNAGMRIGELLGVAPGRDFQVGLNRTNIDLALETQLGTSDPQPPSDNQTQTSNTWQQYLPYVAAGALATITASIIIAVRRRKHAVK